MLFKILVLVERNYSTLILVSIHLHQSWPSSSSTVAGDWPEANVISSYCFFRLVAALHWSAHFRGWSVFVWSQYCWSGVRGQDRTWQSASVYLELKYNVENYYSLSFEVRSKGFLFNIDIDTVTSLRINHHFQANLKNFLFSWLAADKIRQKIKTFNKCWMCVEIR